MVLHFQHLLTGDPLIVNLWFLFPLDAYFQSFLTRQITKVCSLFRPADRAPTHPPLAHHWPQHRIQVAVEGVAARANGQHHAGGGGGGHTGQGAPPLQAPHLLQAPGGARARV